MDETQETQENSLPQGKASEGSEGTTPKQAKTLTEQEVEERIQQDRIARGRDAKTLADKEAALKAEKEVIEAEKAKIADWERQRDEAELAEARRDPDKMSLYQRKQAEKRRDKEQDARDAVLTKRDADLTKREAEGKAEITSAREATMEMAIFELGAKYEVNPTVLKDTAKDLGLTTVQQIEALAKRLSETQRRPSEVIIPASGVISGARGTLTPEQFEKLSQEEKKKYLNM